MLLSISRCVMGGGGLPVVDTLFIHRAHLHIGRQTPDKEIVRPSVFESRDNLGVVARCPGSPFRWANPGVDCVG